MRKWHRGEEVVYWRKIAEIMHRTAIAMQDEAVRWQQETGDRNPHCEKIQRMYMDAAVFSQIPEGY